MEVKILIRYAALAALDRLCVYHGHDGVGVDRGSGLATVAFDQYFIALRPTPVALPAAEVVKTNRAGRKVVEQQAPLATAFD